jgi:[ribosomal protein S5]-alanine N-acetyltransferase
MIKTERLTLLPFEEAHYQAIMQKDLTALGQLLGVNTPTQWTTFADMEDALPFLYKAFQLNGTKWGGFFITHDDDKELLGTCGFKGNPDEEGMVELGYEIHENYRLQGLATETAAGLIDYAMGHKEVKIIRAHTLAHNNPSVSVLRKLNFRLMGVYTDPDDGDVWRWERDV